MSDKNIFRLSYPVDREAYEEAIVFQLKLSQQTLSPVYVTTEAAGVCCFSVSGSPSPRNLIPHLPALFLWRLRLF